MGGLTPGIGGLEWVVIGLVALVVVGPERLPGLLRQMGKWVAKARGMANEFRASFDEMARQSELDELRKEVEALRTGQSPYSPVRLGEEANAAFKDIKSEFDKPLTSPTPAPAVAGDEPVMTPTASEWPDGEPISAPVAAPLPVAVEAKPAPKPRSSRPKAASTAKPAPKKAVAKPRASRAKKIDV